MTTSADTALPAAYATRRANVNGVSLRYIERGQGLPVVCVHGAFADLRNWEPQVEPIAEHHRFIAYDQRYFGPDSWPDGGAQYSQQTHSADLAEFIRQLDVGPVHVIARSYGATVALIAAVQHPEVMRALMVQEPQLPAIVTDPADMKILAEERAHLAPVREAARSGDEALATRLFFEWVNGQPGGFDRLAPSAQAAHLANGRTIAVHFASPPGPRVSCGDLRAMRTPLVVTMGEWTRPYMRICTEAVHRCAPSSQLIVIPRASHSASAQNPEAFNAAMLDFLSRN